MSEPVRELLGITYCETCACDTIPSERTGRCFFCNALLVHPRSRRGPRTASVEAPTKAASRRSPRPRALYGTCAQGHALNEETAEILAGRLRCRVCRLASKS
jgi:hypothetical protein